MQLFRLLETISIELPAKGGMAALAEKLSKGVLILKRTFSLLLSVVIAVCAFTSCNKAPASNKTAAEVFDAINAAFAEQYKDVEGVEGAIPNMPMDVDDTVLKEKFGIDPEWVEDYKGQIAGMMTNCDMLVVVKAKDGQLDKVKEGLEKGKADQNALFEFYGVMGNPERLAASKIVTNGNYAALLMVGILTDNAAEGFDFSGDVRLAEDTFNKTING